MSEVRSRPPGTMSTERRYGIAISVALILGGVYWALTSLTEESKSSQETYAVQGDTLTVTSTSADVEIRAGDGQQITVDRQFKRNVFGSAPKESYADGTLEIRDGNCGLLAFGCDTSYVVTVPRDLKVTVESTSGDLTASDLPGGIDLKSTSGDVDVTRVGGEVKLESTSGDIDAQELTATTATGHATSGGVDLGFTSAPTTVEADTSSGDVSVVLPSGTETYQVSADTSSGDESTNVRTDPAATRTINATTASGDVTVEYDH
jgi:Toastrack DUF4097